MYFFLSFRMKTFRQTFLVWSEEGKGVEEGRRERRRRPDAAEEWKSRAAEAGSTRAGE
jgi:hypothetical protein